MSTVCLPVSFRGGVPEERRSRAEARLRLLIVDDEPLVRASVRGFCGGIGDLQVVGEAASGLAAIRASEELRPDVMLLDVELPDMSGFDVLRAVRTDRGPLGIMMSARARDAATARAVGAIDCLIKPVSEDRLARSIGSARERHAGFPPADAPAMLIGERGHRLYPLEPLKIDYIESAGNYVTFRTATSEYISRDSLKRLASVLKGCGFFRIERSLLLNVRAIS
ncbi:MAG TPA: LytTR family DNA-binding domain-containing protein, partial [Steroidobacteraceae bacterium]|nr:LytTR family DNA-binding domain-containing protein [Steroidobacteraceae bacterium]